MIYGSVNLRCFVLVIAILTGPLSARTPEQTITGVFEGIRTEGMSGVVDFLHDEEIPAFRQFLSGAIDELRRAAERDERAKQIVSRLNPEIDNLNGRQYVKAAASAIFGGLGDLPEPLRRISVNPIGSVREGNLAHVVVRLRIPEKGAVKNEIHVFTVKEVGGEFYFTRGSGQNPFSQFFRKS